MVNPQWVQSDPTAGATGTTTARPGTSRSSSTAGRDYTIAAVTNRIVCQGSTPRPPDAHLRPEDIRPPHLGAGYAEDCAYSAPVESWKSRRRSECMIDFGGTAQQGLSREPPASLTRKGNEHRRSIPPTPDRCRLRRAGRLRT